MGSFRGLRDQLSSGDSSERLDGLDSERAEIYTSHFDAKFADVIQRRDRGFAVLDDFDQSLEAIRPVEHHVGVDLVAFAFGMLSITANLFDLGLN